MIKDQDIICISVDWDRPWGSKQQLMLRLSAHNRVLYVEYQASFLHLFPISFLPSRFKKWKKGLRKINDNLIIFTPCPALPFGNYFRIINKINQDLLLMSLKRICRRINLGTRPLIMWIYIPTAVDMVGKLNERLVLFHCIADFSGEKKSRIRKNTVSCIEKEMAERSDIVLTLTESLYRRYKEFNSRTYFFPSAVDCELFCGIPLTDRARMASDIMNLKRPKIGLVGYLDGKILDIKLLYYIAERHPEWSLVLVGPKFRNIKGFVSLAKKDNVYFLGEKKHDEIPMYLKDLDVCIIPYLVNEFTNNVSSLKLYEYLAMGKPVVATNLAALEMFKDIVKISDNKEGFIENISSALEERDSQVVNKRIEVAKKNSWDARLQTVAELIDKC